MQHAAIKVVFSSIDKFNDITTRRSVEDIRGIHTMVFHLPDKGREREGKKNERWSVYDRRARRRSLIFTLGILDLESGSIPTAASIFFPPSLLFPFPLPFSPSFFFYTSDTHFTPSHPLQLAATATLRLLLHPLPPQEPSFLSSPLILSVFFLWRRHFALFIDPAPTHAPIFPAIFLRAHYPTPS